MTTNTLSAQTRTLGAASRIEVTEIGHGRPILFLHPGIGLRGAAPFLEALGRNGHVIAPAHPGFHGSPLGGFKSVDDLSYLYLSLLEDLGGQALVVGASLGGWIALEIAVKSTANIAGLVLVDSVGVRFGDRDTPDFADLYAMTRRDLDELMYHEPNVAKIDYPAASEAELEVIARNREAETRLSWSPYLHNPRLNSRLHRANVPTLVLWGKSDAFAPPAYGRQLANALPNASFETIEEAGHFPHIEQPDELVSRIDRFAAALQDKTAAAGQMEVAR